MKKKLHLRIRAFVLVLLISLTTFVISPQQALADTEAASDEDMTEISADEEVTPDASDKEEQNDIALPVNEDESQPVPGITSEPQENIVDSSNETDIDLTESPFEPTLEQVDEMDTLSDVDEVSKTPEPEQVSKDVVMDKPDDQDAIVSAQDATERSIGARGYTPEKYFTFDPKTGTITKYSSVGPNNVNIPPNIGGVPVLAIGERAFEVRTITSVTFPNTVRYIGNYAFFNCDLTDVKIPDNVIQIGEGAFIFNKLTSVSISNNITEISERAFESNQLKSVKIPDNVTVIGKYAFCKNELTSITIPNKVTEIKAAAFAKNQISSLTISKSVKMIDFNAFGDNLISNLTIPSNVLTIGSNSFANNTLENLSISNGVKQIYSNAFEDNYLTSVNIPDSVEYIGEAAFSNNELENLTLGKGLTKIEKRTFAHNYLESVTIPNNIADIGDYAFYDNNLADVTISNRVTMIGSSAFYSNYLTDIVIPSSVTIIGNKAFKDNPDLSTATIPISFSVITDINSYEQTIVLISNPSIAQIGEYCFDPGVTFTLTGYAKQTLNLRDAPNAGGSIIGKIPIGRQVKGVLAGNMVKTTYNGKTGYVYASLLQKNPVKATRYIKANSIIRSTPNGSIITRPWRPLRVTGTIQGAWLKFTHGGKTAYVAMVATMTSNPPMTGYAKQTLNLRNTPKGSIIRKIPIGRQVKGVLVGNMVKTTYNGKTGYVYASLLQKNPVKVTRYLVANSIIRSKPNGSVIARPWRPLRVSGTIQGAWLKFTYNGKTAYVAMSATRTKNPPMTGYAKERLNLRSSPKGAIIGRIPIGRQVKGVLVGNMVKTTYNGKTGYVYASLLQKNRVRVTRYIVANAIIRSRPNGSIITRLSRPIRVTGTIQGAWLKFTYNKKTAYVAMVSTRTSYPR